MAVASTSFGATRAFEVGLGAAVGSLSASADNTTNFTPTGGSRLYFAAAIRGRYGGMIGPAHLSFGPELRLNLPPVDVDVANPAPQSIWQISTFTAGLTLELATSLYGSLW
jgi:hypothetical protein